MPAGHIRHTPEPDGAYCPSVHLMEGTTVPGGHMNPRVHAPVQSLDNTVVEGTKSVPERRSRAYIGCAANREHVNHMRLNSRPASESGLTKWQESLESEHRVPEGAGPTWKAGPPVHHLLKENVYRVRQMRLTLRRLGRRRHCPADAHHGLGQ